MRYAFYRLIPTQLFHDFCDIIIKDPVTKTIQNISLCLSSRNSEKFAFKIFHFVCRNIFQQAYDLSTELIAREAGVIVTDATGGPLAAPLDTETDVSWAGYANAAIRDQIAPLLVEALRKRGLLG